MDGTAKIRSFIILVYTMQILPCEYSIGPVPGVAPLWLHYPLECGLRVNVRLDKTKTQSGATYSRAGDGTPR